MKVWTYSEMYQKVLGDLDLEDETFIKPNEMVGYFNEAISEAASEILVLNQEYFLSKFYIPVVQGRSVYDLPWNIYSNKIRGIMYSNGSIQYQVKQYRRSDKFADIVETEVYGTSDYYRYYLVNNYAGQARIDIKPLLRESAIMPPQAGAFTPLIMWYIRNCARIPILKEYCNIELVAPSAVVFASGTIQTLAGTSTRGIPTQGVVGAYPGSIAYITGDIVRFTASATGTLPGGITDGTAYYVIAMGAGLIKLATSLQNAIAGTAISLSSAGTVSFMIEVQATTNIINATLIDIPEFATFVMQWVKCRCMEKEGDPRIDMAVEILTQQKKQMVDTLTEAIVDDDTIIEADYSFYRDQS